MKVSSTEMKALVDQIANLLEGTLESTPPAGTSLEKKIKPIFSASRKKSKPKAKFDAEQFVSVKK